MMIKQLTIQGLRADLGAAESLLAGAQEARDPVAALQFAKKIELLRAQITDLAAEKERLAQVALFFGGRPVSGSRGIDAEFAGQAVEAFQRLITRQFAQMEVGSLGVKGPVPVQSEARLMITDIARGSVGFYMEEAPEQEQLVATELATAIEEVADAIGKLGYDGDDWADAIEGLDDRVRTSMKEFFSVLDDAGASFRIVQGSKDREMSFTEVHRARIRSDQTRLSQEMTDFISGQLVGFTSKTFEFIAASGERLTGRIASGPAQLLTRAGKDHLIQQLLFSPIRAQFDVRTLDTGTWTRKYYVLVALDDRQSDRSSS